MKIVWSALKLMKYLYKHKFKYENKPIKWMWETNKKLFFVSCWNYTREKSQEDGKLFEVSASTWCIFIWKWKSVKKKLKS